jgi:hypothetical protein
VLELSKEMWQLPKPLYLISLLSLYEVNLYVGWRICVIVTVNEIMKSRAFIYAG